MANRNKQPFYGGGDPSFPLSEGPYHSRVENQRINFSGGTDFDRAKNYQFLGFRPGFALQASELNEIQEHFQMQLTLSISMMNNWITSGGGFMWTGANTNSPLGVGGGTEPYSYPTSIGRGGGFNGTNVFEDESYQITAPGWRGTCPLYPYGNPYFHEGDGNHEPAAGRLVTADNFSSSAGEFVRINFYSGWYLTEVRPQNQANSLNLVSGLKHWVYLDSDVDSTFSQKFSVDVPVGSNSDEDIVVGLIVSADYVGCEGSGDTDDPFDSDLADNAAGVPNSASCGASRFVVNFESAAYYTPTNGVYDDIERDQISLCVKVNPQQQTVRYMNNQLLLQW